MSTQNIQKVMPPVIEKIDTIGSSESPGSYAEKYKKIYGVHDDISDKDDISVSEVNDIDNLPADELNNDDPDCVLPYYRITPDLMRKFRDKKLSATGRLAFDYIVMNASSITQGISRRIDIHGLADFLGVGLRRAYKIIDELIRKSFVVPRDEKNISGIYDIPDLKKVYDTIQNHHKSKAAKKKLDVIEEKIYALAKIFNINLGSEGDFGFDSTHHNKLVEILSKTKKDDIFTMIATIAKALKIQISNDKKYLIRDAFNDIDKHKKT